MTDTQQKPHMPRHLNMGEPSLWFKRFRGLIKQNGTVLDVAAGGGRHVRYFGDNGFQVTAIDKNIVPLEPFVESHSAEIIEADMETGKPWPLGNRTFDAVIVKNYLYRPHFSDLLDALAPGGVFLYETFALGNEVYNRPRNPDHLLKSGELLSSVQNKLQVIAYQHGIIDSGECPGVKQMICAVNNLKTTSRDDGEPEPSSINL